MFLVFDGAVDRTGAGLVGFPRGSIQVVECVLWLIKNGFPEDGSVLISQPGGNGAWLEDACIGAGRSQDVTFVL